MFLRYHVRTSKHWKIGQNVDFSGIRKAASHILGNRFFNGSYASPLSSHFVLASRRRTALQTFNGLIFPIASRDALQSEHTLCEVSEGFVIVMLCALPSKQSREDSGPSSHRLCFYPDHSSINRFPICDPLQHIPQASHLRCLQEDI